MASELSNFGEIQYVPLEGGEPSRRQRCFFFVIDALLRSRQVAGLETGSSRADEDVNMYLTGLLCRYATFPVSYSDAPFYPYETDLFEKISSSEETRAKYLIYRYHADHLLVTLGIFGNAWWRLPRQSAFAWAPTRAETISRGQWYYGRAATYATRLEEAKRGLDDLLGKLEEGFLDYLRILETLRSEYFHLIQGFSQGEWFHLCQDLGVDPD